MELTLRFMFNCDCHFLSCIVYFVGLVTIASKVVPFLVKKFKGTKPIVLQEKNYKKDVVYLYQFHGTHTASSLSPYCIKVEAFCRLHEIKFERRNTVSARGENDRVPFIELNGEVHSDSQIILRRLTHHFNIKTYPDEQTAAIGHAIDRLLDNHTSNLLSLGKLGVYGKFFEALVGDKIPSLLRPLAVSLGGHFVAQTKGERAMIAVGKFTEAECRELLKNDLLQLQNILGRKKFLLGGESTAVDCTAFGQFGSNYYAIPSARFYLHDLLESSEFLPLKEYIERVKDRIFGDEFCDKK